MDDRFVLGAGDSQDWHAVRHHRHGVQCTMWAPMYRAGVAGATSPTGPFTRKPANPIGTSNATWGGPGHGGFAQDVDGTVWFLYHARHQSDPNYGRVQVLDKVSWTSDGWPSFGNSGTPSTTTQAGPRVQAASGAGRVSVGSSASADEF